MAAFAMTTDRTVFPGGDISSAPNWMKVKCHTLWHGASVVEFVKKTSEVQILLNTTATSEYRLGS